MQPHLSNILEDISKQVTDREIEILQLISFGFSTERIADMLYISFETVRTHRKNLLQKFRANNVALLIRRGFENGLICAHRQNHFDTLKEKQN
ncbi:MAG: response regulator transcription factor [Saprospiraceae bacterium]|nr:response regulator transcription factor [Saprospiraceae bacterium]